MKRRNRGDASFVLGLVLGLFVGAAIAIVLSAEPGDNAFPTLNKPVEKAKASLEEGNKVRTEGASEGAAE
ncbi:MAG: hypothetical protein M3014_09240 [Chloroflexota bacterium]|nr:hypothetical protein [Chloroflexota bacterium]